MDSIDIPVFCNESPQSFSIDDHAYSIGDIKSVYDLTCKSFNDKTGEIKADFTIPFSEDDMKLFSTLLSGSDKRNLKYYCGIQHYDTPDFIAERIANQIPKDSIVVVMFDMNLMKWMCSTRSDCSRVFFISDKCLQKSFALKNMGFNAHYFNIGMSLESYNDCTSEIKHKVSRCMKQIKEQIDKMKEKSDNDGKTIEIEEILVSNPPYNNGLDIKILNEVLPMFDQAFIVHPAPYLLSNKKFTKIREFQKKFWNNVVSADLFNGNKMFGIKLSTMFTMTAFDMHKTTPEIRVSQEKIDGTHENYIAASFDEIHWMGKEFAELHFDELMERVLNMAEKHGSIYDKCVSLENLTDYSVKIGRFGGSTDDNGIKSDFFSMVCKNESRNMIDRSHSLTNEGIESNKFKCTMMWAFDSEDERHSFIVYLKSKIARFFLSYYKMNKNLAGGQEISILPWLGFCYNAWNDNILKSLFQITDEQWHAIDRFIPDYYDDYSFFAE